MNTRRENVLGGIVGAFLGSLIGVAVMVLLGQIGFVSAVSGIVMGVCALKGYEILGGKLSTKGIIFSVIIMIIMVYVGNRLDFAITLHREVYTEDSLTTVFRYLDKGIAQLKAQGVDMSGYGTNLAMQYGFSALGAASTIISALKGTRKKANKGNAGGQDIYGKQGMSGQNPYGQQGMGGQNPYGSPGMDDMQGDLGLGDDINMNDTFDL